MFGVLLAKKQRQVTNKVADAGSKMLENEEEEADDNDDEENQVSSDTVLSNKDGRDSSSSGNGSSSGGSENDTTGQECANISYRKLVTVSSARNGQFSCSIFEDKTRNSDSTLVKSQDFIGDIRNSNGLARIGTRGDCKRIESKTREEFGANFKGKLDEDNLRHLANKTSENAQLKRFKSDGTSSQQQNDQMRQSFQSSFERSTTETAAVEATTTLVVTDIEHGNPLADSKQQQRVRRITAATTTTMMEADSQKQNGTRTGDEMASNNSDYMVNQNRAKVRVEASTGYATGATSLAKLDRATITVACNEAADDDDGDGDQEDEQTSAQVATLEDGNEHLDEYGATTVILGGRYDETGCRLSSSSPPLSLASITLSPSNVATAVFGGQGQLTGLSARQQQPQQESQSAPGTNQVLVADEEDMLSGGVKSASELEGSLHFGPGSLDAFRRQPLMRACQRQRQQPELLAPSPSNTNDTQHQAPSRSSRCLSIAQRHHTSDYPGDGRQQRRAGLVALAKDRQEPPQHHASGDGGNDRSCASHSNENYKNHVHLAQATFETGLSSGSASLVEDNKEKWYEQCTPSDATARSAFVVNKKETQDGGDLYRLAMIDQKDKKETMTENLKQYPPNHPLGNSKHLCAICGDRATGKHYGVFSCEGCKGFFKRTIRKDIVYVCRAQGDCLIDMRQRNRCQYCRYQKCLSCGMKREAVQEEKQRLKLKAAATAVQQLSSDISSSHIFNQCDTSEIKLDSTNHYNQYNLDHHHHLVTSPPNCNSSLINHNHNYDRFGAAAYHNSNNHSLTNLGGSFRTGSMRIDELTLKWAAQVQIECLLDWAKSVPKFTGLLIDDQVTLLKAYWNELIIAHIAFKTAEALRDGTLPSGGTDKLNSLCIGRGLFIDANQAHEIGLGNMFNRIIDELVIKMRDMRLDVNELACLRAIILFNPETHGLKTSQPIEEYRGDIYTTLEAYCRRNYENQPNRFGKLLLRLPALRSIGLKCDSMRQQRRCDSNINQVVTTSHQGFVTRSSPASRGSSSPTNSSVSSISSTSTATATTTATTGTNPNYKYGYQVKLFFGLCYELSSIDSFLRSSFSLN